MALPHARTALSLSLLVPLPKLEEIYIVQVAREDAREAASPALSPFGNAERQIETVRHFARGKKWNH